VERAWQELIDAVTGGEKRALGRLITRVENREPGWPDAMKALYPKTGAAQVVGITGPPGAGKSSLTSRIASNLHERGQRVGIIAVDPTSPFSGGALLGDRIRMRDVATTPGIFIRSMATRGLLGGLARASNDAIDLLDAAGFDPILVETVGVGQDEIDIVKTADVVSVILVPGLGDDIQAIKAGILEIADLFVINKSDRDGADRVQADLEFMLSLAQQHETPRPEIFRTVAVTNEGIDEFAEGMVRFHDGVGKRRHGQRRRDRARSRLQAVLGEQLLALVQEKALPGKAFDELVERVADRELDPYSAVRAIVERVEVR
jgi:LAO/AO transport system kinase